MRYPIETTGSSGLTIYAIIHHPDGRVWNNLSFAWETYNGGLWADYAIALVEQGSSGYYKAVYPASISGVLTTEALYSQSDVAPSTNDAPSIGIGQSQGAAIAAVEDSVLAADNLKANLDTMIQGSAVAGVLAVSQMTTDLPDTTNDVYVGRLIVWTSGALIRRAAHIVAYHGATGKLTFSAVFVAPSIGDTFIIV